MVLRIGQKVSEFSLPDTEGATRSLGEFTEKGAVVLAFFPFAFSGACDKEMCAFRDGFAGPLVGGAQVVGVSVDSAFTLKAFAQTYNLQFPLLSDFGKKVTKLYGVLQDKWVGMGYRGVAKRSVFVVDQKGALRYKWVTDNPGNEPPYDEVMKAVARLTK
ncbi:MAG: redoxin domain-containing protein [Nitrososphaerales archaeon]|nr:redoxin domain-containing protein [Nitrososphaerales archaeon]